MVCRRSRSPSDGPACPAGDPDATAERITTAGLSTVGLLGTRFTMEEDFYRGCLEERFGLRVLIPTDTEGDEVHRVIYEELCRGEILEASRDRYREIVSALVARGAEGVILGCTEIGLLLSAPDASVELFDTAAIHAEAAVCRALEGGTEGPGG